MEKSTEDWLVGIFCIFLGIAMFKSCNEVTSKEIDYISIKGVITDVQLVKPSSRRARSYYCFKIDHPLYKSKWFSNRKLYDMTSGVHYKVLLQPKKRVKFHVLKHDIWNKYETLNIFSLYLDQRSIVSFGNQWKLKLQALGIGMLIMGGGCLMLFSKE